MAKKRDNTPIDEWDDDLEQGIAEKRVDPFYGPLTSAVQENDDDWGFSTETVTGKSNRSSRKTSRSLIIILSVSVAVILLVGGIILTIGNGTGGTGGFGGLISTPTPSPTLTTPPTPTPSPTPFISDTPTPSPTPTPTQTPEQASALMKNEWYGTELRYYYQQLTSHEKEIFEQLYNGIVNCETKISVSPCSREEMDHVLFVIHTDSPELFHFHGGTIWSSGSQINAYEPDYRIDRATYQSTCTHIHRVIDQITDSLPAMADDYEKERAAYYWMIDHCEYLLAGDDSTAYTDACLYYGRSQCSGYAAANALVLRTMGVNSLVVVSDSHAWNIVRINSRWYQCDATWDDQDIPWKPNGNRFGDWLNVPDRLVTDPSHRQVSEPGFSSPKCNSLQDNYSYREGVYIEAGKEDPARYFADALNSAQAAGKYSVSILIDDPAICADWDRFLNRVRGINGWSIYPPTDTQTAFAIYNP